MNITFCVSSMPNQRMVSGISAATGRLRPKSASGAAAASTSRYDPAMMPSGTPTMTARPNPISTRFSVAAMLCMSARSLSRLGKLLITSTGLGRMIGETKRSSDPEASPLVASHHSRTMTPIATAPASRRVIGDGESRIVSSEVSLPTHGSLSIQPASTWEPWSPLPDRP